MSDISIKRSNAKYLRVLFVIFALAALTFCVLLVFRPAFAAGADQMTTDVINSFIRVISLIVRVVGAIFVVIGFIQVVIAHANEDGPQQQKAAMRIAVGIVLIILPTILSGLNIAGWITSG